MTVAELVLPCPDIAATQAFFEELGFRVDVVTPADDPIAVVVVGYGVRLRLDRRAGGAPGVLRLVGEAGPTVIAPNGTRIERVAASVLDVPPLVPSFHVERAGTGGNAGRAGMRYRDLVPDRQGGRVIASHISIPDEGPVPDYVHYHVIRYQLIYCHRGWVRVVYEDQGPSFVMEPGDCVLQPPRIRHRVLECGANTEVVEVTCPSSHDTFADHVLELPSGTRERTYDGQRFARSLDDIRAATSGLVDARIVTRDAGRHDGELLLLFVVGGRGVLRADGEHALGEADCVTIPAGLAYEVTGDDLRLLRVAVAR